MPMFTADLSVASLDQLLSNVKAYQKKIDEAPEKISVRLAEIGAASISENLSGITDTDGNVPGTVGIALSGSKATVYQQGDQIAYIEFGTGAQDAASRHPQAGEVGWNYDSGTKIHTMKNGKRMWRYWDKLKGHWRITSGLPAQKQVYRAALKMRDSIPTVAKEALK